MAPLLAKHFHEIAKFKEFPPQPNVEHYTALEKAGILRIFTAREGGKLIGYSVFNVINHPHFRGATQAHEELLFLDPDQRKGMVGAGMISFCDSQLKDEGVKVIYHSVSKERDFSPILERMGYELSDRIYSRRVG